jgi:hypothetical protein
MSSSPDPVPRLIRELLTRSPVTKWEWRHVKGVAAERTVVGVLLAVFGSILCSYRVWWGLACFPPTALALWFAREMPRWKQVLEAEQRLQAL